MTIEFTTDEARMVFTALEHVSNLLQPNQRSGDYQQLAGYVNRCAGIAADCATEALTQNAATLLAATEKAME